MHHPTFSIIIPTYQRRQVVTDAVRSLARLNYDEAVEVIVVVDGSTDGTADALAKIDCPFPLRIIDQANGGAACARNRGAGEARHDVLLFLDDDMICDPELLREHARTHLAGGEAVIGDVFLDSDSPPGFMADSNQRWIDSTRERSDLEPFDVFTGQLSVRRTLFAQLGGFDAAFTSDGSFSNEDADFGVALLANADVRHNPAAITRHRYVVTPRELMRRAPLAAQGDLLFMRKHPQYTGMLLHARGMSRPLTRFVHRPLAAIPGMTPFLGALAVMVAQVGLSTRWRSSRMLARAFSAVRLLAYWSEMRKYGWFPASDRLLALCYHAIADQRDDPVLARYGVPLDRFTRQLDWLAGQGYVFISPTLLLDFLAGKAPLPRRAALLTFDDGYPELLELARTVLAPRKIEALVFAVTGIESGTNEWDQVHGAQRLTLLTEDQLKALRSFGVEVGSHSRTHRILPELTDAELVDETSGSMADFIDSGLPCPRFFAFPYGARNAAVSRAVQAAGYSAAFGPRQDRIGRSSNLYDLPRVLVLAEDHGWRFRLKMRSPQMRQKIERLHNGLARRLARVAGAFHGNR